MVSSKKSEHPLTAALRHLLTTAAPAEKSFCVALSGGMDSAALLSAALPLRDEWQVLVCHVNHGISPRAKQWAEFCRDICQVAAVPLIIHQEPPPSNAVSEQWARQVRHRAFAALPVSVVVLAHHAADQAETILFRLLRGAGTHGMAAMRPQTPLAGKTLLRPWLTVNRQDIAAYASTHNLRWIEDEDNRNISRRRNFIRWQVMPTLANGFPNYSEALAASGRRMRDTAVLLSALAEADEQNATLATGNLSAAYFRALGDVRTRNWLYHALSAKRVHFSEQHITEVARQLTQTTKQAVFSFQGTVLRQWRDTLYWDGATPPPPAAFQREVRTTAQATAFDELGGALVLSACRGGGLSPKLAGDILVAQLRCGGERLTPPGRPRLRVANLLREANIAPWRRGRLPLLFAQGRLAAVPGIAVAAEFAAGADETGLACHFDWQQ